jgi:hypothetical protein
MLRHHQLQQVARARPAKNAAPLARLAPRRAAAPPAATAPTTTAPTTATADAFAAAVTGEWEGVTATFSPAGDALDLPERFVPQAFREWDMVPKDWQSQCSVPPLEGESAAAAASSSLASSSSAAAAAASSPPLRYASRRMMPTVGCEADAVAFTEDMAVIGGSAGGDGSSAPATVLAAVAADGAYAAAPALLPADGRATVRVEACFPLPESSDKNGRPERLRVVQTFTRDWTVRGPEGDGAGSSAAASPSPASLLRLEGVELHREFREGPYTARVELLGCGGGSPPISKLERTPAEAVGGAAAAAAAAASAAPSTASPTTPPGSLASPAGVLTLLPLGAWSHVRRTAAAADGGLRAEAGVASAAGRRRVIAVEFAADGALASASIVDEE